jgi:calcineurin-like phosphoesterase family protein/2'-5' RNA ligase
MSQSTYLIEIRIIGRIKHDIINLIKVVNKKYQTNMHNLVPHVTLVGPFETDRQNQLLKDFESVCKKTDFMHYNTTGIDLFSKSGVVYLDVEPTEELEKFRSEIRDKLKDYCKLSYWDFESPFKFHATIANRVDSYVLDDIVEYINGCKPFVYDDIPLIRATLLKKGKTLCEYDFTLGRMLYDWVLEKYTENKMTIKGYYEEINNARRARPRIFFTSDLHLNDRWVIGDCNRPFSSVETMNNVLVNNWNSEIMPYDTVYYLGDIAHKHASTDEIDYWLRQLNGNIIYIKGDDDRNGSTVTDMFSELDIELDGNKFHLTHAPARVEDQDVWCIHGHSQNRSIKTYPFIKREWRNINVSTDVTSFRPISLDEILNIMKTEPRVTADDMVVSARTKLFRERAEVY